jgi:hypothetical protein
VKIEGTGKDETFITAGFKNYEYFIGDISGYFFLFFVK